MSKKEERVRVIIRAALSEQPPPSDAEGRQIAISAGALFGVSPARSIAIYEEEVGAQNGGRAIGAVGP
jgi:hypothetical protein